MTCSQVPSRLSLAVLLAQASHSAAPRVIGESIFPLELTRGLVFMFPSLLVLSLACIHQNLRNISCHSSTLFSERDGEIPRGCLLGGGCWSQAFSPRAHFWGLLYVTSPWAPHSPPCPQPPLSSSNVGDAWSLHSEILRWWNRGHCLDGFPA